MYSFFNSTEHHNKNNLNRKPQVLNTFTRYTDKNYIVIGMGSGPNRPENSWDIEPITGPNTPVPVPTDSIIQWNVLLRDVFSSKPDPTRTRWTEEANS